MTAACVCRYTHNILIGTLTFSYCPPKAFCSLTIISAAAVRHRRTNAVVYTQFTCMFMRYLLVSINWKAHMFQYISLHFSHSFEMHFCWNHFDIGHNFSLILDIITVELASNIQKVALLFRWLPQNNWIACWKLC